MVDFTAHYESSEGFVAGFNYRLRFRIAMPQHAQLQKKRRQCELLTHGSMPANVLGQRRGYSAPSGQKLFADHTQSLLDEKTDAKLNGFTAGDLLDLFLDWIKKHHSPSTSATRCIYCERFVNFKVGNAEFGGQPGPFLE